MLKQNLLRLVTVTVGAIGLTLVGSTAAFAAPTNDDFAGATTISTLPFTTTEDTTQATSDPNDPTGCSTNGSVWFAFTPSTSTQISADTFGSGYDTVLSAWTGSQGALQMLACNDDSSGTLQSMVSFPATAGTTYYLMAAVCCGTGGSGGGSLQLSVSQLTTADNDNFANAMVVDALPFVNQQDLTASTVESGEPSSCFGSSHTVWYAYTPTTTQSVSASVNQYGAAVAGYSGSGLSNLTQLGCSTYYSYPATFRVQAGTTYYFQVGLTWGDSTPVTFRLTVAANPTASFYYSPGDPSAFDTVQFTDNSYDPANAGIVSWDWDFGDGATGTGQWPVHRFAADGDYTVRLTVTTRDGRTASTSQLLRVRTHDVSIVRMGVPQSAHAGQTVTISVYLTNTRYDESVRLVLDKSVPGGFTQVGLSTQTVLVKTGGQTTRFLFSYTVTSDDALLGKITFRATATIVGYRDALPADNELLSTPVNIV